MKVVLRRVVSVSMVLPLLALALGCGGSKGGAVAVEGKVNYKGAPVTGGKLTLYAKGSDAGFTIGIGADGNFSAGDLPKELIGVVTVTVDTGDLKNAPKGDPEKLEGSKDAKTGGPKGKEFSMPDLKQNTMPKAKRQVYVEIPAKYADPKKTDLTWEIKSGKNEKTFDLN